MSILQNLLPKFLKENIKYYKLNGFKKTVKKLGWNIIFLIFLYYFIRDSILFIIIPYFVGKGLDVF